MHRLAIWIQAVLVPALGPVGLFLLAFLDTSFLSLPGAVDVLVISAAVAHPAAGWVAVASATAGATAGCGVLWWIGVKGGEGLLSKRFGGRWVLRARETYRTHGMWALAVPAMLPPPAPFKLFALAGGVFAYPLRRFLLVIGAARGLRYGVWAVLAAVWGDEVLGTLRRVDRWAAAHAGTLLVGLAGVTVAAVVWLLLRRARGGTALPPEPSAIVAPDSATIPS